MTQNEIKQVFTYKDGVLYWNCRPGNNQNKVGKPAGTFSKIHNRVKIQYKGKIYGAHQLIFLMFHGYIPKVIDHIDRNPSNNRIENLRETTFAGNAQNASVRKDNVSGVKNVCWHKRLGKWGVSVSKNRKIRHFGYYNDLELAELVALEARDKLHGKFAYLEYAA
jgi:hypothetical protein